MSTPRHLIMAIPCPPHPRFSCDRIFGKALAEKRALVNWIKRDMVHWRKSSLCQCHADELHIGRAYVRQLKNYYL